MEQNIEKEYKVLLTKNQYNHFIKVYPFTKTVHQSNTYYDTPNQDIKKMDGALRIRTIENKNIFTLKIKRDASSHFEYEKEISCTSIDEIKDAEILEWLQAYDIPPKVHPIVSFSTIRKIWNTDEAEISLDMTSYENHIDYEIEYEYKKNHDGLQKFQQILNTIHVIYKKNCPSKIARAFY